jgi:hypothetical protein
MKILLATLALACAPAFAGSYGYTAQLGDGSTLITIPQSRDCSGGPSAALLDKRMMDFDHTCEVKQTGDLVTATFRGRAPVIVQTGNLHLFALPRSVVSN